MLQTQTKCPLFHPHAVITLTYNYDTAIPIHSIVLYNAKASTDRNDTKRDFNLDSVLDNFRNIHVYVDGQYIDHTDCYMGVCLGMDHYTTEVDTWAPDMVTEAINCMESVIGTLGSLSSSSASTTLNTTNRTNSIAHSSLYLNELPFWIEQCEYYYSQLGFELAFNENGEPYDKQVTQYPILVASLQLLYTKFLDNIMTNQFLIANNATIPVYGPSDALFEIKSNILASLSERIPYEDILIDYNTYVSLNGARDLPLEYDILAYVNSTLLQPFIKGAALSTSLSTQCGHTAWLKHINTTNGDLLCDSSPDIINNRLFLSHLRLLLSLIHI